MNEHSNNFEEVSMTFSCPCGWRGNVTCPLHGGELNGYKAAYQQALAKNQAEYKDLYARELEKENQRLRAALEAEQILNEARNPPGVDPGWRIFAIGCFIGMVILTIGRFLR